MATLLKHIVLEPESAATTSIIWFHGLGADGHDFVSIVPQLTLPATLPIRFIFPHAPVMPVSINGGYSMPAWFDITSLTPLAIDEKGLDAAIQATHDLIQAEIEKGILSEHIILAGFSQGGAVALSAALTYSNPLGGVIALSTFMPATRFPNSCPHRFPIFMAHGILDDVVPVPLGKQTFQLFQQRGFNTAWKEYAMAHEVCHNEIEDISAWLQKNCGYKR